MEDCTRALMQVATCRDEDYANQDRGTSKEAVACAIVEIVIDAFTRITAKCFYVSLRRENISPPPFPHAEPRAAFDVPPCR